tara:strand:+ start:195 stop:659 length:465 start_codon:yes stop_codon:yes gene_type:complete
VLQKKMPTDLTIFNTYMYEDGETLHLDKIRFWDEKGPKRYLKRNNLGVIDFKFTEPEEPEDVLITSFRDSIKKIEIVTGVDEIKNSDGTFRLTTTSIGGPQKEKEYMISTPVLYLGHTLNIHVQWCNHLRSQVSQPNYKMAVKRFFDGFDALRL